MVDPFKLATEKHSLARVSRRIMRFRSTRFVVRITVKNFIEYLGFRTANYYRYVISGTFHLPYGILFTFRSRY